MKNDCHIVEKKYVLNLNLQQFAEEEEVDDDNIEDYMKLFGVDESDLLEEEPDEDDESEEESDVQDDEIEEPPAKEGRKITVKFNKEDVEVDVSDEKLPEYVQKALALDKERERKEELEKALNRAAKLEGFKDHAEFIANLDKVEQDRVKKQKTEYDQLQESLLSELENNGADRELALKYLENNPLLQQAKAAIEEKERLLQDQKSVEQQKSKESQWNALFQRYPNLVETSGDEVPSWYTPEMSRRVEAGYDPIDAYELAHKDKIVELTRKQTEQATIKKQTLNKRSRVVDSGIPNTEPEVPEELSSAFAAFGLPTKLAKKYVKK